MLSSTLLLFYNNNNNKARTRIKEKVSCAALTFLENNMDAAIKHGGGHNSLFVCGIRAVCYITNTPHPATPLEDQR